MAIRQCKSLTDAFCYVYGYSFGPKQVSHKIFRLKILHSI